MTNIDVVKQKINQIENGRIQSKQFLDENHHPLFITNVDIQKESGLSEADVIDAMNHLKQNEANQFIVFDNLFGLFLTTKVKRIKILRW